MLGENLPEDLTVWTVSCSLLALAPRKLRQQRFSLDIYIYFYQLLYVLYVATQFEKMRENERFRTREYALIPVFTNAVNNHPSINSLAAFALKCQTVGDEEFEPSRSQCKQSQQCGDTAITGLTYNRLQLWLMLDSLASPPVL